MRAPPRDHASAGDALLMRACASREARRPTVPTTAARRGVCPAERGLLTPSGAMAATRGAIAVQLPKPRHRTKRRRPLNLVGMFDCPERAANFTLAVPRTR